MADKVGWLAVLLVLAGCGADEARVPAGRLAARVNGVEITVRQSAGAPGAMPMQLLDKVIDRELAVQQALKEKLDHDPAVAAAMEEARREALARAWLERAAAAQAKATPEEVHAFYVDNPALFSERRVYRLREVGIAASSAEMEQVREEATSARDLDELAGWLKWRNLKVGPIVSSTQAAEQLPLGYLPKLARMREGEIAVLASPPGAAALQLLQAQDAPLSEEQAAPLIERFVSARKRLEAGQAEIKRLRAEARIEYVGDFKR